MLNGIPKPMRLLIVVLALGVFQLFIISLTKQNEGLFSAAIRSAK